MKFLPAVGMPSKADVCLQTPNLNDLLQHVSDRHEQMSPAGGSSAVCAWAWGGEGKRSFMCCHGKLTVYLESYR